MHRLKEIRVCWTDVRSAATIGVLSRLLASDVGTQGKAKLDLLTKALQNTLPPSSFTNSSVWHCAIPNTAHVLQMGHFASSTEFWQNVCESSLTCSVDPFASKVGSLTTSGTFPNLDCTVQINDDYEIRTTKINRTNTLLVYEMKITNQSGDETEALPDADAFKFVLEKLRADSMQDMSSTSQRACSLP
jgi:hypothetical protein